MAGYTLLDLERETFYEKGYKKGLEESRKEGVHKKELILIRNGWKKGLSPEFIAELGEIPFEKVMKTITDLEEEKQTKNNLKSSGS